MAHTTLTLSANGRLPGALSGSPTASTDIVIASGVVAYMPHVTSSFTCNLLSCLGANYNRGRLGAPSNSGEPSGVITTRAGGNLMLCSVGSIERNTSSQAIPKGGGVGT